MRPRCYLDWNAGAPLLPEAAAAVADLLSSAPGNASSAHAEGRSARAAVEKARAEVAALAGVSPPEVVFTSGGAEANALAMARAAGRVVARPGVEHASVLAAGEALALRGTGIRAVPVDSAGVVDLGALAALLDGEEVGLLCVQLANSETGVVQPVAEIARLARGRGVPVHCDAVQAAGKLPLADALAGVETVALSAHKLGGLAGAGALVVRAGVTLPALIPGTQERHRRGGTENVAGIVAFGVAARLATARAGQWEPVEKLRDRLESALLEQVPAVTVYGRHVRRLPNTSCLGAPPPLLGGVIVAALDLVGFAVSSGSACSSGVERSSTAVEAMGYGEDAARRTVRVSLGPLTTAADVRSFVDALVGVVGAWKGGGGDRLVP